MKIMRINNNFNKINTREELIELLKNYNGILNCSMINYLNSLIDLEFSVIKNYISDNDRISLSELEVYKKIALYNIYNRALDLFKQNESKIKISGNNDGIEGLNVYASLNGKNYKLFNFDYQRGFIRFKTNKIGNISLFQTIESKEQRQAELERVKSELDKLYKEKNLYNSKPHTYGGPASQWAFEHYNKIKEYERELTLLDSKKELTDEDKKEIEITNKFNKLLLEDYGLKNNDFEDFEREKSKLHKTLVKKIPNINIKNNIKYV